MLYWHVTILPGLCHIRHIDTLPTRGTRIGGKFNINQHHGFLGIDHQDDLLHHCITLLFSLPLVSLVFGLRCLSAVKRISTCIIVFLMDGSYRCTTKTANATGRACKDAFAAQLCDALDGPTSLRCKQLLPLCC